MNSPTSRVHVGRAGVPKGMLTLREASARSGIHRQTLIAAARRGELAGRQAANGYGSWYVSPRALAAYQWKHRPMTRMFWSEADLLALRELVNTCSLPQAAAYMGRTAASVTHGVRELKNRGLLEDRPLSGTVAPFDIPRTAILLAKTCPTCGFLRDAELFPRYEYRRNIAGGSSRCVICVRKDKRERARRNYDPVTAHAADEAAQKVTLESAVNRGKEWTSAELEALRDISKPDLQLALELGRTYYSTRERRRMVGVKRKGRITDSHWIIDFPNAMAALREHFRELGVVPESEWDWNEVA